MEYYAALVHDFEQATPESQHDFLESLRAGNEIRIAALPSVATSVARVDGKPHVFLLNFTGVKSKENPVQTPQSDVRITLSSGGKGFFLPFLGEVQAVTGVREGDSVTYRLPVLAKGAVFWVEP